MTGNPFPDDSPVLVRYPLTEAQARGDRAGWPWLPGWIDTRCGPDEWAVVVQDPRLATLDGGTAPQPGTPEDECQFPVSFRDSSEIRLASPA